MEQLTLIDRFVLFVVRRSESAVSVRALTRLTGLTSGEVDEALQRLALQGSIEIVEPQGETCYRPIDLSDVPLVIDFEEWLEGRVTGNTEMMCDGVQTGLISLTEILAVQMHLS